MSGDLVRSRWRDAILVTLLALVLVAGLVYYGVRLSDDTEADPVPPTPTATSAPTPSIGPAVTPTPEEASSTCWDGRPTTDLSSCGLPQGAEGLAWVFPSFSPDRPSCRENPRTDRAYAVVTSYLCSERAHGQAVTVAYDQVADIEQVETFVRGKVSAEQIVEIPGAHGGRCVAWDSDQRPVRITGWYEEFPYVVSVFAPTKRSAERAWNNLVRLRPAQAVRGR